MGDPLRAMKGATRQTTGKVVLLVETEAGGIDIADLWASSETEPRTIGLTKSLPFDGVIFFRSCLSATASILFFSVRWGRVCDGLGIETLGVTGANIGQMFLRSHDGNR